MTINNHNLIGYFVLVDEAVWKITSRFQDCLTEAYEYECQRIDKRTGKVLSRTFSKGDKDVIGLYKTRERAEIARLNMRITELEERLDSFIGIINEVRENYNLL